MTFSLERLERFVHQMHGTNGMMKAGMKRTGIYEVGEAQLFDSPESLEVRMFDHIENKLIGNIDEPIYRIVENLSLVQLKTVWCLKLAVKNFGR